MLYNTSLIISASLERIVIWNIDNNLAVNYYDISNEDQHENSAMLVKNFYKDSSKILVVNA